MSSVKVSVMIEVDGDPVKGFPLVRRFEPVDRGSFEATLADNASFVAFPAATHIGISQFLLFQPIGAAMAVKMMGDGTEFTLNKGGLVLVLDSSDLTGTTVQNNSGGSAKAVGQSAGT